VDGRPESIALSWARPCGGLQFLLKESTMGMSAGTRNDAPAVSVGFQKEISRPNDKWSCG
jgi:hypothetical protein